MCVYVRACACLCGCCRCHVAYEKSNKKSFVRWLRTHQCRPLCVYACLCVRSCAVCVCIASFGMAANIDADCDASVVCYSVCSELHTLYGSPHTFLLSYSTFCCCYSAASAAASSSSSHALAVVLAMYSFWGGLYTYILCIYIYTYIHTYVCSIFWRQPYTHTPTRSLALPINGTHFCSLRLCLWMYVCVCTRVSMRVCVCFFFVKF